MTVPVLEKYEKINGNWQMESEYFYVPELSAPGASAKPSRDVYTVKFPDSTIYLL